MFPSSLTPSPRPENSPVVDGVVDEVDDVEFVLEGHTWCLQSPRGGQGQIPSCNSKDLIQTDAKK